MFTQQQIHEAHSKVKSGADFPAYIAELKALGVAYETHVATGKIIYRGTNNFTLPVEDKWPALSVSAASDKAQLQMALSIHQQGQTSYPIFCQQAAAAGVEKWIVDLEAMTCSYFERTGQQMLVESIPNNL